MDGYCKYEEKDCFYKHNTNKENTRGRKSMHKEDFYWGAKEVRQPQGRGEGRRARGIRR